MFPRTMLVASQYDNIYASQYAMGLAVRVDMP